MLYYVFQYLSFKPWRENDDDCKLVLGVRNEAGELDGNVNLQWSNGDMFKVNNNSKDDSSYILFLS